ncbi:MAG: Fe-S cluster assembly protein SufD [Roseivirga sp.]
MSSASSLPSVLRQRFEMLDKACPFYAARQQAMQDLVQQGLPTAKDERYKYTPLADQLAAHGEASSSATAPSISYHDMDAYHLVLVNGRLAQEHSQLEGHERFMQMLTFREAYQQQLPAFSQHFAQHALSRADPLVALNTALFEEGIFIRIHDHAIVDQPLVIHHFTTGSPDPYAVCPRLLVVAGARSQASLVHDWQTKGWNNAVAEVVLKKEAQVDYYTLQTALDSQAYHVNTVQCHQAQQSLLNTHTFTWSGALVRNNLHCAMAAPHSELNMYGLYALQGQQHVDNSTAVDHRQPHTSSNERYKGLLMDRSTGVFNGRIYVQPEAQQTQAFQANHNLVLSEQATLHTKPQLEIWADDVRCSHGATTSQLDPAQLFYLRSRGIPASAAQSLLRQAFAHEMVEKVPLAALRNYLLGDLFI